MSAPSLARSPAPLELHWPEYFMEAGVAGIFMISVCVFSVLLEDPASDLNQAFESSMVRRALVGVALGLTMIGLISSSWGQRSGAHMNPAVTLTYFALGKMRGWAAAFYVAAQFGGAIAGVGVSNLLLGFPLGDNAVNF